MLLHKTRALDYLQRCDLAAVIATSATHITYLSDYQYWGDAVMRGYMGRPGTSSSLSAENYAVLNTNGDGGLVVPPLLLPQAEASWVAEVRTYGKPRVDYSLLPAEMSDQAQACYNAIRSTASATAVEALIDLLQDWGLTNARIGLELEGVKPSAVTALKTVLPNATFLDCSNLLRLIRAVKSPEEIRRISQSTRIAEEAALASLNLVAPGKRLPELVAEFRARIGSLGADYDHYIIGVHGMGLAESSDYRLQADDILLVDYGCRFENYASDSGQTVALGNLSPALTERYAALYAGLQAGAAELRPGTSASAVRAAMQTRLTEYGITTCFAHGHGFGLEPRDYPIIVENTGLRLHDDCIDLPADLPLEVDMVINLETPLYLVGSASLHIEQTFLVTPAGGELLVPLERSEPLQPKPYA